MPDRTVTTQVVHRRVAVPAGTPATAPVAVPVPLGDVHLDRVAILVPPGHMGLTGVAIDYAGQRIAPWAGDPLWFVVDDTTVDIEIGVDVTAPVVVRAHNADVHEHGFWCRFTVHVHGAPDEAGRARPLIATAAL